ncbi:MAG: hypothetical protein KC994_10225 [Candidatus Omnitrophica bacterium]|nr:hypothetical protein [Candidatus Omnitrophota bacterium]
MSSRKIDAKQFTGGSALEDFVPVSEQVLDWKPKTAKSLRSFLNRLVWINYAAYVVSLLLALFVVFGIAIYIAGRWTFYNPPYGHPVTLFHCAHALVILLLLWFWAWPRIRRPKTLPELAARIEKKDRRIALKKSEEDPLEYVLDSQDERLTSAVTSALEFSEPDPILQECLIPSRNILSGSGRASDTKGFYERVLIDLKKRNLWKWVIPTSLWVTSVLALIVFFFALFLDRFEPFTAKDAFTFYKENFLVNPYRPLHKLVVNPGSVDTVLKGESFKVSGILMGPGTHEAEITYSMLGFPQQTADMSNNGPPNSFVYEFENLQSDLTYQVKAGPLESPPYTAKVRIPPELTSIRLTYYYPDFMKKKFELMPAGQGAAVAPLGTTVEVTTQWNQGMNHVDIVVNSKETYPMRREGNYYKGSFPLVSAGAYVLSGTSSEGVRTRGDIEFPIQAMVDLPPEIEWVFPKQDLDFSSTRKRIRRIPLRFTAKDDFGLHSITLYAGAPGRTTSTYEVARLDGKVKEHAGEFLFDLRPFENTPVCRVFFLAADNHPGSMGTSVTEVRRLYFEPPGSFAEEDSDQIKFIEGDPFEMTSNELFALIKMQQEQNDTLNENTNLAQKEKADWLDRQKRLVQLTTQTVILANERANKLLSGPGDPNEEETISDIEPVKGEEEEGKIEDLSTRLQQVINRLSGGVQRLGELQPGKKPTGNSAIDRQLRQWDAGEEERNQRSREEGERAYKELELAFKELTGKDLPVPVEEQLEELEEEDKQGEGVGPGDGKSGDEGEGKDGEKKEGEEGEGKGAKEEDEGDQVSKKGGKGRTDTWATVEGEDSTNTFTPGGKKEGDEGKGEEEAVGSGGGPTAPTNQYIPSAYTLDPETVHIETPASSLMRKELSKDLAGIDLNQYRDPEIPKEYRQSASEYGQTMSGE